MPGKWQTMPGKHRLREQGELKKRAYKVRATHLNSPAAEADQQHDVKRDSKAVACLHLKPGCKCCMNQRLLLRSLCSGRSDQRACLCRSSESEFRVHQFRVRVRVRVRVSGQSQVQSQVLSQSSESGVRVRVRVRDRFRVRVQGQGSGSGAS